MLHYLTPFLTEGLQRVTEVDARRRVWNSLPPIDRHVAAVTARVQATAQDCGVCPLLQLLMPHTFAPRSRLLILLITVRCPSSR